MTTLNTFFETQQDGTEWANSLTKSEGMARAKQAIEKELSTFQIPQAFYEMLIMKLCEAMDLKIGKLLVDGYKKHQEIIQYRDKKNPQEGYHEVTLLEHTLESKHSPKVVVIINKQPRFRLTFNITLKLKLSGGKLYIRDGKIWKASTGSVKGSGTIDYEGFTILKKETESYDLPGMHPFEPAVEI